MRIISKLFVVVVLVSAALTCMAQQKESFDRYGANVALLQAKPVQEEVGITAKQLTALNEAADTFNKKMQEYGEKLKKEGKDPSKLPITDPTYRKYKDALKDEVCDALTVSQLKRLRELSFQRIGLTALLDPVVAGKVGMSKAQQEKFKDIYAAGTKEVRALEKAVIDKVSKKYEGKKPTTEEEKKKLSAQATADLKAEAKKAKPQIDKSSQETQKKLVGVLTEKQKKVWQDLLGKPFSVKD